MQHNSSFKIGDRTISIDHPTYFIADIAANHDGDLERAKDLIWRAKEAGADCAKFQHFVAEKIVSDVGFSSMTSQMSHQTAWKKSVFEIYDQYHTPRDWTPALVETCEHAHIEFMTTPYDFEAIDSFADIVPAYKIGSGDITFFPAVERIAKIGKPVLLATGAATMGEIERAVDLILDHNQDLCLMQCNTNYTGSPENFGYVNLNVLSTFSKCWPGMVLGLSDHTPGHSAVLGAIALGARVVEKHFTDDNSREGPDHKFALNPQTWRTMIDASRELEAALGDGVKRVEENEKDTVVIQRRAVRVKQALSVGTVLDASHVEFLRPCPLDAVSPDKISNAIGKKLTVDKGAGEAILWTDLA